MASLGDDTANSMAGLGLGPGLSAAPGGQGLFSTSLGSSLKGVNQSVTSLIRGLREVNSLMTSISKNAAAMRGHFAANGGASRSLFTNGGLGSGQQQNLGLGSFSTPVAGSGGGMTMPGMMSARQAKVLGFGTAGLTAAFGALGGAYTAMPGVAETKSLQMNLLPVNLMNGMNTAANGARINSLTQGMGNMTGAANSLAWMGYNPTQGIGARLMQQSGAMGQMLGVDPASLTGAMGNISPATANRMKILGVSYFNKNGDPMDASQLANVMYDKLGLNKVKDTEKISRDINQAGYNSYNALNYYITDPAQRELVKKMMVLRASNGGQRVNTGDLAKLQSMTGGAMGIAGAEGSYGSQHMQTVVAGNDASTRGAQQGYGLAGKAEELIRNNPLFETMAQMKAAFETFSGTGPGQGAVQTASSALKALTTAATTAAYALMLRGGGSAAAGLGSLLRGGAAGGAAAAGGAGAGAVAGVAGAALASGYAGLRTGDIYSQYKNNAEHPSLSNLKDRDFYLGMLNPIAAGVGASVGAWNRIKGMVGLGDSGSQSFSGGAAASVGGGSGGGSKGLASKSATGSALVAFAKRFVGTPYVWGGVTTKGWDCSGFVKYVFRQFGKNLPRTSRQQAGVGKEISYKSAQPGDLLFFGSPVHHVAIYAGNGMMVHAANRRLGTIVSRVWGGLTHVRRVLNTSVGGGTSGVGASPSTSMKETDAASSDTSWNPIVGTNLSTGVSGISATLGSIMDVLGGGSSSSGGAASAGGGDPGTTDTASEAAKAGSAGGGSTNSIVQAIRSAGFSGGLAKTMWAIAMAESSGNARAHNTNARTGDNSYGLWQINMLGKMGPERRRLFGISSNDALFDPATNARAAMAIYKQQGLNAWSTYKHGTHNKYLADAPGFSKGAWSIDKDQVANIHQGEMILPASLAHAVRTSLQRGATSGGGGASGSVTINVYPAGASDSEAVRFGTKLKSVLDGKQTFEMLRTT